LQKFLASVLCFILQVTSANTLTDKSRSCLQRLLATPRAEDRSKLEVSGRQVGLHESSFIANEPIVPM